MSKRREIPEHIRSALKKAVRDRYPELPMFYCSIDARGDGYSATVTFQNQSRNADGSTKYHGNLSAVFEYRGLWHMTSDWND